MSISTILLDFGGVIQTPNDPKSTALRRDKMARTLGFNSGDEMWLRFYTGEEWLATKTGQMTDDEMWRRLLAPYGLENRAEREAFVRELFRGEGLQDKMRELIFRLYQRFQLAILSNASDTLEQILREKLGIIDLFQVVVNSHRIGVAKPDREAFKIALKMIGSKPAETLFVDDQRRNTEAAEQLGLHTYLFTGINSFESYLQSEGLI